MNEEQAETGIKADPVAKAYRLANQTMAVRGGSGTGAAVVTALHAVMNDVNYVHKGGENKFHGYKYASEADTIAALRPSMLKHGLVLTASVLEARQDDNGNTHVLVEYTLRHTSGEYLSFVMAGSGNDRNNKGGVGDKGVYKALTGALKYALRQTFMLETGDDPEKDTGSDEKEMKAALETAEVMIRMAHNVPDQAALDSLWRSHHAFVESARSGNPELFARVKEAFSNRKQQLAQLGVK